MTPAAKRANVTHKTTMAAAKWPEMVKRSIPANGETMTNETTRIAETRLAMVIESKSDTIAKTMQKGKTTKINASSIHKAFMAKSSADLRIRKIAETATLLIRCSLLNSGRQLAGDRRELFVQVTTKRRSSSDNRNCN